MGESNAVPAERDQPLQRRGGGAQRGRPEQERLLGGPLVLVEKHHHQAGPAAEPAEHRALADPGGPGEIVHRDRVGATLGDQPAGGVEQQLPVAGGVTAFGGYRVRQGQFDVHLTDFNSIGINRTMVRLCRVRMDMDFGRDLK